MPTASRSELSTVPVCHACRAEEKIGNSCFARTSFSISEIAAVEHDRHRAELGEDPPGRHMDSMVMRVECMLKILFTNRRSTEMIFERFGRD
jgi:hypothetical protein